jgi:hypothetical protein
MKFLLIVLALPLLTACERDPAAPTAEENRQLDEAGQMLNEAPANLDAVDDYGLDDNGAEEPR